MHRLTSVICAGLMLCAGILFASAQSVPQNLQGNWIATSAEQDGKPAGALVGHRLSFADNRFRITSKEGKLLFAGTVSVRPSEKPAAIDFDLTEQPLKGTSWKGIFVLDGDTLTICDNAPDPGRGRPTAFETKVGSGYVLVRFQRARS